MCVAEYCLSEMNNTIPSCSRNVNRISIFLHKYNLRLEKIGDNLWKNTMNMQYSVNIQRCTMRKYMKLMYITAYGQILRNVVK